jgi:hypothetical protein
MLWLVGVASVEGGIDGMASGVLLCISGSLAVA